MSQLALFQNERKISKRYSSTKNVCYLQVKDNIPVDIPQDTFISIEREQPLKIYSLGFQPAKSIPEIPRWFLCKYASVPHIVLEPFAGSGTTIIESIKSRASVYWLDYNPLSRLICRVKTQRFNLNDIREEISKILKISTFQKHAPEQVKFSNKDFWFQKPVQEALEILREHIMNSKETVQSVLWLAFASTVRKSSDMNDGMILAARRSHIKEIPKLEREDVFRYFHMYAQKAFEAVSGWQEYLNGSSSENVQELPLYDSRNINGKWKCDSVITSPPYINAIDYVWASKFELHWLGFVQSDQERLDLYSKEIGTERIPSIEYKNLGKLGHKKIDQLIEDIYYARKYKASKGQNHLRARVVYKYFFDMKCHLASCFSMLKKGGYYCFTIGDISKICGVEIPVASILSELACEAGFRKVFRFYLLLKNRKLNIPRNVNWAGTINHDTTVVLEKPGK